VNRRLVDEVAAAVLYEGYILYPYRASALKNQQRFNFGVVSPRRDRQPGEGGWFIHTECLVRAAGGCELDVRVRFLHLTTRTTESPDANAASRGWQEAIERDVPVRARLDDLCVSPIRRRFGWPAEQDIDPPRGAEPLAGAIVRSRESLHGEAELSAWRAAEGFFKIAVRIANLTPLRGADDSSRDALLQYSLVSTHAILHVANGEFVSLLDPPAELRALASTCRNVGVWPVLIGEKTERDAVLASPIILYDHPAIAAESAGDFFDGTEIDEMLVLRILTMTDEEKREMRGCDPRARKLLERTEHLPEDHLMKLHGVLRSLRPAHDGGAR
jgi:hypothetical protein